MPLPAGTDAPPPELEPLPELLDPPELPLVVPVDRVPVDVVPVEVPVVEVPVPLVAFGFTLVPELLS